MTNRRVITPTAEMRETPDAHALRGKYESQLVYGETFFVEEEKNGWARGHSTHDGYAGWVEAKHLGAPEEATHIVTAARTSVFRDATMKSPLLAAFSFNSRLRVSETGEKFSRVEGLGWIPSAHLSPVGTFELDHVKTAMKFLETPYAWGGRSGFGIDCSGLVQVFLQHAGIAVRRDTELQEHEVGTRTEKPQRGDLVYFKGHVGVMTDSKNLLHANATHMKTCIEPLADVVARGAAVTGIRRV
jgi:cell wall-associated NlpC family hydrolase